MRHLNTRKQSKPLAWGLCIALAGALGTFSTTARADSYLNQMLANPNPDFVVNPYLIDTTATGYQIHGQDIPGVGSDLSMLTPSGGSPVAILLNIGINTSGTSPTGTLTQDSVFVGASVLDSNTLIDFAPVVGHPGISYYFTFKEESGLFAVPGDVIGGLLTVDASGNPLDLKEYVFTAVPTPAAAQGGLLLTGVMALSALYRRTRTRQA